MSCLDVCCFLLIVLSPLVGVFAARALGYGGIGMVIGGLAAPIIVTLAIALLFVALYSLFVRQGDVDDLKNGRKQKP